MNRNTKTVTKNSTTVRKKRVYTEVVGLFLRVRMRDFCDGYTIFDIREGDHVITCTGNILVPKARMMVRVMGEWTDTAYGRQLQNCTLRELLADAKSIYEYLLKVPGVGPNIATAVSENIGMSLPDLIRQDDPVKTLMEKTKIHEKAAKNIVTYIKENQAKTTLFSLLSKFGPAYGLTERIFKQYGENCLLQLMTNPYDVGMRFGMDFGVCDYIAKMRGEKFSDDPKRMTAAAFAVLTKNISDGDCRYPFRDGVSKARHLLSTARDSAAHFAPSGALIANALMAHNDNLILEDDQMYTRQLYWQEVRTAYAIRRIIRSGQKADCDPEELCTYAESVCGVKYAEQQREAFQMFRHGGLCVLTGGPGTGKTTVVKGLLTAYEKLFPDNTIRLCAPTGRASQRMKEATEREACTVHRLIEYRPYGDSFSCKCESDPIEADLIVVDESSMISIDMAELLFSAIKSGTMVLLVGDTAQLPSVGPGNVLADIIRSGVVPVCALTKTHRQGAGSPIIENAKRINAGEHRLMQNKDFSIMELDEAHLQKAIRNYYIQYHKDNDPFAVQILCTTRKDPINGCHSLSKMIQKEVNPRTDKGIRYGDVTYHIGDKVMMTRNNYEIGYFNGDVGLIRSINNYEVTVEINGEMIRVPTSLLEDMELAYASTIHKSQGSEYGVVIVVLPNKPISMLQRNILYTAITRAKQRVILISTEQTIFTCVNTLTSVQRKTHLCERLRDWKPNSIERMPFKPRPEQPKGVQT